MEHVLPLLNPGLNRALYEFNVSKDASVQADRSSKIVNSFKDPVNDFEDEDSDLINLDPLDPFNRIWDNPKEKSQKYKENFPKDDSLTDTNFDSTDTEPTDTDIASSSDSELSMYRTTTDESDESEPINPHPEDHGHTSPSFDQSEDDSDESTDSEYFDSDASTESSEGSYTSLSENIDDSPDPSITDDQPDPNFIPTEGGPPETFKWSEDDEQMEIPVKDTGAKTFDPFEEDKKGAMELLDPEFGASADPSWRAKGQRNIRGGVSGVVASITDHLAPSNSVNFEWDVSERMSIPTIIRGIPAYKDKYRYSNSLLK